MMQSKGPITVATKRVMKKAYLQALKDGATRTEAKERAWHIGVENHKMDCIEIDEYIEHLTQH